MKGFLSTLYLFFPFLLLAQTYAPLLEQHKVWTVEYADYVIIPPEVEQQQYTYTYDTLINSMTYGVYAQNIFLREDTIDQKAYKIESADAADECLLYDFAAQPGDTIDGCDFQYIIDSVSTILLPDGSERNIFYYRGGIGEQFYIEGIGSYAGLIELSQLIGPPSIQLMCVRKNGDRIYGERCDEVTSTTQPKFPSFQARIFPNPASSFLKIETDQSADHFRLVQFNGQVIHSAALPKNGTLLLDNLANGYYILELYTDENQLLGTKSIVVQR